MGKKETINRKLLRFSQKATIDTQIYYDGESLGRDLDANAGGASRRGKGKAGREVPVPVPIPTGGNAHVLVLGPFIKVESVAEGVVPEGTGTAAAVLVATDPRHEVPAAASDLRQLLRLRPQPDRRRPYQRRRPIALLVTGHDSTATAEAAGYTDRGAKPVHERRGRIR